MARVPRLVVLPALAVLLPCAVVSVLAYQWLALERESAARRSSAAMEAAAINWRRELKQDLQHIGEATAEALSAWPRGRPPFQLPPAPPAPIDDAYLFNAAGALVAPDYEVTAAGAAPPQAETLLASARASYAGRQLEAADRYARNLFDCCAAQRDEFGVAFVWYAAWQRALIYREARRPAEIDHLLQQLLALVKGGYLATSTDVIEAGLLAKQVGSRASVDALAAAILRAQRDIERRRTRARLAQRWLPRQDEDTTANAPVIGRLKQDGVPAVVVVARVAPSQRLVMLIRPDALGDWARGRVSTSGEFDVTLNGPEVRPNSAGRHELPLFTELPDLRLAVNQRPTDAVTERRRERLFMSAIAAALLTIAALGYFAVRDVSREMRTARLRSSFVAAVTHELKTPLASIRLLAETLRWGRERTDTRNQLLDTIVDEADRVSRLVDDVLSSSRIESGTRVYSTRLVSTAEVVRSAIQRVESLLRQESFDLVPQIEDSVMMIRVDPDALEHAIVNLLDNAMKYSRTSREIRLVVARHGSEVEISVADFGMGVPASEQRRIFDRFYRTPEAAAETAGAGLGLALVRHFAESHGGRVTVSSQSGAGSVFSMWLSVAVGEEDVAPALVGAESRGTSTHG